MDPALPQSETTPPVHALDENTSGTIRADPFSLSHPNVPNTTTRFDTSNLSPSAVNVLSSSSEVNETFIPAPN